MYKLEEVGGNTVLYLDLKDVCKTVFDEEGNRLKKNDVLCMKQRTTVYRKGRKRTRFLMIPVYDEQGYYKGEESRISVSKEGDLKPFVITHC